jgi:hypothetical protein
MPGSRITVFLTEFEKRYILHAAEAAALLAASFIWLKKKKG